MENEKSKTEVITMDFSGEEIEVFYIMKGRKPVVENIKVHEDWFDGLDSTDPFEAMEVCWNVTKEEIQDQLEEDVAEQNKYVPTDPHDVWVENQNL